ncbi:wall-associated receptor kinase-like 15 [Gastrolobium bilobum]|uniref:wall-associated receptor kinase-like 15 n=1 Tax=Gastrolobium bilobum TaxID=150636 RepID=UPI002AB17997|nr:wall-associated receptor kinase-like 15 [Gastrolobium bilobum]
MAPPPLPSLVLLNLVLILILTYPQTSSTSCSHTCGSLQVKYPFGTGPGCGSPLFNPYITCKSNGTGDQLFLKTHTGSYPITSISYTTSTLTLTPHSMSTCTIMQTSPNLGLDWTTPFQISSSTFILLSCKPPTSSLSIRGSPICDLSLDYLCASIYTCPAVEALGLSLFPPTNTCCVYSPANLDGKGELDLSEMKCGAYASVMSLGDNPIDPTRWVYGVALKYSYGAFDTNYATTKCNSCEYSGGLCGYAPPGNGFVCVCKGGYNTSLDCSGNYNQNQDFLWTSISSHMSTAVYVWSSILAGIISSLV